MLKIVNGNLFDAKEKYICHQCNCITQKGGHLSKSMFDKFSYANVYKTRERVTDWKDSRDKPGNIDIRGNGKDQRFIINMFAQVFPGTPRFPESSTDGHSAREKYFLKCLEKIQNIENLDGVAFPYCIGCGAAGGEWKNYLKMIDDFSKKVNCDVVIYKLNEF